MNKRISKPPQKKRFSRETFNRQPKHFKNVLDAYKHQYNLKERGKNARLHKHEGNWFVYSRVKPKTTKQLLKSLRDK